MVLSDEEVKIDWNLELAAKLSIDGPALVTRLLESDRNAAQVIVWGVTVLCSAALGGNRGDLHCSLRCSLNAEL